MAKLISTPEKRHLWIEVEREKPKKRDKANVRNCISPEDELPILLLSHFAKTPRISFGSVRLNSTKDVELCIQNPNDYSQIVTIDKVPIEKGFITEKSLLEIEPNGEETLTITWNPDIAGNYRELLTFRVDATFYKQVILLGTAVSPYKKVLQVQNGSSKKSVKVPPIFRKPITPMKSRSRSVDRKTSENQHDNSSLNFINALDMTLLQSRSEKTFISVTAETNVDMMHQMPEMPRAFRNQARPVPQLQHASTNFRLTPGLQRTNAKQNPVITECEGMANSQSIPVRKTSSAIQAQSYSFNKHTFPPCDVPATPKRRETFVSQSATCLCEQSSMVSPSTEQPVQENEENCITSERRQTYTLHAAALTLADLTTSFTKEGQFNNNVTGVQRKQTYTTLGSTVTGMTCVSPISDVANVTVRVDQPAKKYKEDLLKWNKNESEHVQPPVGNIKTHHNRRTKIPEPSFKSLAGRGHERRKRISGIFELEDSLETDKSINSSMNSSADSISLTPETRLQESSSPDLLNRSLQCSHQRENINVNENQQNTASSSVSPVEGQNLEVNDLNYKNFCQQLHGNKEVHEDSVHCPNIQDNSFIPKCCSTEVKSNSQRNSRNSSEKCKQLFDSTTIQGEVQRFSSETFVVVSPPPHTVSLKVPLGDNSKGKENRKVRQSRIPSLQRSVHEERNTTDEDHNSRHGQGNLKRNKTKTQRSESYGSTENTGSSMSRSTSRKKYNKQMKKSENIPKAGLPTKLTLIKPPAANKVTTPRHPNPFAAKNVYYDEQWIEKQTQGFIRWLNFILTLPDEFGAEDHTSTASKSCVDFNHDATFKHAPSRESLSLSAYTAGKKLNILRREACKLFQSEAIVKVVTRLEQEIESRRIVIRNDKALHADVGIKQKLLELILSYNPLWLRIGLETVFGQLLRLQSNDDTEGLSQFLLKNLLNSSAIAKEYAHSTVPHLYKPGYATTLKKHTLKKFLLLVFFLDQAKQAHLIKYNPCLFRIDAKFKSSRELLLTFSRDHLSGEGDVTKHLASFGYKISHVQTVLNEYDFSVTNLATDLRNGLRLARATELLSQNWTLMSQLRVPAVSRTQKIHNVTAVLNALAEYGTPIFDVTAKNIVYGHCEKTLSFLWQLIFNFQINVVICEDKLKHELSYLEKSLQKLGLVSDNGYPDSDLYREEKMKLLLRWCQLVCAHYKVQVENFTVAFSDGRVLCYLIHHYHPQLIPAEKIHTETTQTWACRMQDFCRPTSSSLSSDDSFGANWTSAVAPEKYEMLLQNEQENFKLALQKITEFGGVPLMIKPSFMSNTIPDEKVTMVFTSYMCARFLDLTDEIRAARIIQQNWRQCQEKLKMKDLEVEVPAVIKIQRWFRKYLLSKTYSPESISKDVEALTVKCTEDSVDASTISSREDKMALKIQKWFRRELGRKRFNRAEQVVIRMQAHLRRQLILKKLQMLKRIHAEKLFNSAVTVQKCVRMYLMRKQYLKRREAIIYLQAGIRRYLWRKSLRCREERRNRAATCIQENFKKFCAKKQHERRINMLTIFQALARGFVVRRCIVVYRQAKLEMERTERIKAAISIQSYFRMYVCKKRYRTLRYATLIIQSAYYTYLYRRWFLIQRLCARRIQTWYRACIVAQTIRSAYSELREATVIVQSHVRMWLAKRKYLAIWKASIVIQSAWRRHQAASNFRKKKAAVHILQCWLRGFLQMKNDRSQFLKLKMAAVTIQKQFRMKKCKLEFQTRRFAAIIIQKNYRCFVRRRNFQRMSWAALVLQTQWRRVSCRNLYKTLKQTTIVIQSTYRSSVQRRSFLLQRSAAIKIQTFFRAWRKGTHMRLFFLTRRQAAVKIQTWVRKELAVRRYQQLKRTAISIQKFYRRSRALRRFYLRVWAVAVLQLHFIAFMRGRQQRFRFLRLKNAATVLQRQFRARKRRQMVPVERMHYVNLKCAVVTVQKRFRSKQFRCQISEERARFLKMKHSVVTLQSYVRMWKCKREYRKFIEAVVTVQKHWRGQRERKNLSSRVKAAILIQRRFRAKQRALFHRHEFLNVRSQIVKIQAAWRGKCIRKNLQSMTEATIAIQVWFRANQEVKRQRRNFLLAKRSAIKIQALYRGSMVRKKLFFLNDAATVIQTAFRGWSARRCFYEEKMCAQIIQQFWRNYQLTVQTRNWFLTMRRVCINMQSHVRGALVRRQFIIMKLAIICIQANVRCFIIRRMFLRFKASVICIQQHWRGYSCWKKDFQYYHVMRGAAIVIQSYYRGYSVRKRLMMVQGENRHSTPVSTYCHELIRFKRWKDYHVSRGAAITIQAWTRGWIVRRQLQKIREIREAEFAEKLMENYWRVVSATLTIQAAVRGYLTRKRLEEERCVCGKFRCRTYIGLSIGQYFTMRRVVLVVEKWYQIVQLKKMMVMSRKDLEHKAANYSQSTWRLFRDRQMLVHKLAAVKIQRHTKRWMMMKEDRDRFLRIRSAAVTIQTAFRGLRIRRMYLKSRELLENQRTAEMIELEVGPELVETAADNEKFISRQNYLLCFASAAKIHLSALRIQRTMRRHRYRKVIRAVIRIQTAWRGYCTRKKVQDKRVSDVRNRIFEVTRSASHEHTLWHRTTSALDYLFHCRNLSTVWSALSNLNTSTRLSPVCCERLAYSGGATILYQFIQSCNRSLPHMEVILECLGILLNLAKHNGTIGSVWMMKESIPILVNVLRIYYEKNDKILLKCASVLWMVFQDKRCVVQVKQDQVTKNRITNFCAIVSRRHSNHNRCVSGPVNHLPYICFEPDWVLGNHKREFTNCLNAMSAIMNLFSVLSLKHV